MRSKSIFWPKRLDERSSGVGNRQLGYANDLYTDLYSRFQPTVREPEKQTPYGGIYNLTFSPDGSQVVAATERRALLFLDPLTQRVTHRLTDAHTDCVNIARFLDSRVLASGSDDSTVALWDIRYLKRRIRSLHGHTNWVKNIEYVPSDGTLVTSAFDGNVQAWQLNRFAEDGPPSQCLLHLKGLMRMRLTPAEDKMVLCTSSGLLVLIHDLQLDKLTDDMKDFKPDSHWRHHAARSRNRVELVVDFPKGNQPDLISSLQLHPQGWCVLSRNANQDEASEWSCVHDIQSTYQPRSVWADNGSDDDCNSENTATAPPTPQSPTPDDDDDDEADEADDDDEPSNDVITSDDDDSDDNTTANERERRNLGAARSRRLPRWSSGQRLWNSVQRMLNILDGTHYNEGEQNNDEPPDPREIYLRSPPTHVMLAGRRARVVVDQDDDDGAGAGGAAGAAAGSSRVRGRVRIRHLTDMAVPEPEVPYVVRPMRFSSIYSRRRRYPSSDERNNDDDVAPPVHRRPRVELVDISFWTDSNRRNPENAAQNRQQQQQQQQRGQPSLDNPDPRSPPININSPNPNPNVAGPSSTRVFHVNLTASGAPTVREGSIREARVLVPPPPLMLRQQGFMYMFQRRRNYPAKKTLPFPSDFPPRQRLLYYAKEPNVGRGFIKELCFSSDGRLVCSPYAFGVRYFAFDSKCSELSDCVPSRATQLTSMSTDFTHANYVVSTHFSPTHCLLASGCLSGEVVFHQPRF